MQDSGKGLIELLTERAAKAPGREMFGSRYWLSSAKVLALVMNAASDFTAGGICDGDHVALICVRSIETAVILLALRAAGAVITLLDPRVNAPDALSSAEARIPIRAIIAQEGSGTFRLTRTGCRHEEFIELSDIPHAAGIPSRHPDSEPAFIIFTSGSTGKNKAVVLTEGNLISVLESADPFGGYRDDDRALMCLPFNHVFGLLLFIGSIVLGYATYFPEKTDILSLLSAIEKQRLTRMNGVPSLYLAMADKCAGFDLSSLRIGLIGGSPVTPDQFRLIERKLGITLIPSYGMSECASISIASCSDPQDVRACSSGRFYPGNTWKIMLEGGREAQPGEEGEILVNGPGRMYGYYGHPLGHDEMIATGDLGCIDAAGNLHITGRKKDILIRNGNNISPVRIEQALLAIPGVQDAVVVGIPDERQGEVPAAMVVAGADVTELDPELPRNELPAMYMFAEHIPMTASGKPDKQLIRRMFMARKDG